MNRAINDTNIINMPKSCVVISSRDKAIAYTHKPIIKPTILALFETWPFLFIGIALFWIFLFIYVFRPLGLEEKYMCQIKA